MRVDIEDVIKLIVSRKKINHPLLSEIEFYRKGVKIEIKQSIMDDWDFTGLSNIDFASMNLFLESEYNLIDKE